MESAPKPPDKPMRPVPVYPNLGAVLALDATQMAREALKEIDDLAAQLLSGNVDWSQWEM